MAPPHQWGRPHITPTLYAIPPRYIPTPNINNKYFSLASVISATCFGNNFSAPLRVNISKNNGIVSFHYYLSLLYPTEPHNTKNPFENYYNIFPSDLDTNHHFEDDTPHSIRFPPPENDIAAYVIPVVTSVATDDASKHSVDSDLDANRDL
eukprot:CAMPEP_0172477944 /NCGR_PEP_ID=MMETSP1066-20121228/1561_1 /TAXON_ID=671091 /ORGANISM="Coscinodiscus wailesii, Strain CCMP2513" /LENGTH=150 /DNA_ID=CAMNT_0013237017 /DNA_START=51 /DNA_END=500 /DNA_ORIENTATION=-